MATVTSRLPALIDYLVNLFTTAATIGAATPPVRVFDGPYATLDPAPLQLYVGLTDVMSNAPDEAATSVQTWAALGRLGRDETVTIHCVAYAWSGTDDAKTMRVAAMGIVAAVEAVMQADTTQFGGLALFPDPGVTQIILTQGNNNPGSAAAAGFDLIFRTRIGGF